MFDENKNFFMRDVGRATSAAPTFFPSAEIKNINGTKVYSLIDGGVGQNNPAKLVLDDVRREAMNCSNQNNYFVLSLGTGLSKNDKVLSKSAGVLNILPIIECFNESNSDYVDMELQKNFAGKYTRVQPLLKVDKSKADIDSLDPDLLNSYIEDSLEKAEEDFTKQFRYGYF